MITIKNSKELEKLVDKNKDLTIDEDIRIEFEPRSEELRDVKCKDLFLMNDDKKFNFNGRNFNGWDFNGWDFNGRDFNGRNFNGGNFNGRNFNGGDFNGRNFNGRNFNGWDFNGRDFNGGDFNGGDFNGRDFNGKKVSYWAFFNCTGFIKYESIEGRRQPCNKPISLIGEIECKEKETEKTVTIEISKTTLELLKEQNFKIN